ncbi:MAG: hypothetical protein ACRDRI_07200 [Pseudonocardiaceae bacterium]
MGELRSRKQQREQLVCSLRASGASWVEVAAALQQRYRVNLHRSLSVGLEAVADFVGRSL